MHSPIPNHNTNCKGCPYVLFFSAAMKKREIVLKTIAVIVAQHLCAASEYECCCSRLLVDSLYITPEDASPFYTPEKTEAFYKSCTDDYTLARELFAYLGGRETPTYEAIDMACAPYDFDS